MKAVVMHEYGGPDVLKYEDVPDPVPGTGEVLIRIAAASINPVDLWQRAGAIKASLRVEFPAIIGWDVSGTVVGLGLEVHEFAVGDHVFAWAFHTYAELCAVKTSVLARIPDGVDLIEAAALPLVTVTGSQLISVASGVKAGQTVLVSGAVGGVGRAAVRTAVLRPQSCDVALALLTVVLPEDAMQVFTEQRFDCSCHAVPFDRVFSFSCLLPFLLRGLVRCGQSHAGVP